MANSLRNFSPLLKMGRVKHLERLVAAGRTRIRLDLLRRLESMGEHGTALMQALAAVAPVNVSEEWFSDHIAANADVFADEHRRAIDDLKALLILIDRLDAEENPPLARVPFDD